MTNLWLLSLVACAVPHASPAVVVPTQAVTAPPAPREQCPNLPLGDPSQRTLVEIGGFTISPLMTCEAGSYIRIERTTGSRRLGTQRMADGRFTEGCMKNLASCKRAINVTALLELASIELAAEHVVSVGIGAGPCASDLEADYSGWNFAIRVHDWKDADRAIAKLTEMMLRYDLRGDVGVAVTGTMCVVQEGGR